MSSSYDHEYSNSQIDECLRRARATGNAPMTTQEDTKMADVMETLDAGASVPVMVTGLVRVGVKRPVSVILDNMEEARRKVVERKIEQLVQEEAMQMDGTERKTLEEKVDAVEKKLADENERTAKKRTIRLWEDKAPPVYETDYTKSYCITIRSGRVNKYGNYHSRDYKTKETPFPQTIVVRNDKDDLKAIEQLKALLAEGRTARAFFAQEHHTKFKNTYPELVFRFGRKLEDDRAYVTQYKREQEEKKQRELLDAETGRIKQQFEAQVATMPIPDFEAFIARNAELMAQWNARKEELLRNELTNWGGFRELNVTRPLFQAVFEAMAVENLAM